MKVRVEGEPELKGLKERANTQVTTITPTAKETVTIRRHNLANQNNNNETPIPIQSLLDTHAGGQQWYVT